jgi:hypothetical protein
MFDVTERYSKLSWAGTTSQHIGIFSKHNNQYSMNLNVENQFVK